MTSRLTRLIVPLGLIGVVAGVSWVWLGGGLERGLAAFKRTPPVAATWTNDGSLPSGTSRPPVPLLVTSADELLTSSPAAGQQTEADIGTGGRLIVRWAGSSSPERVRLWLTALSEPSRDEPRLEQTSIRVQLGPYARPLVTTGTPRQPDAAKAGERHWSNLHAGAWQVVALPGSEVIPVRVELPGGEPVSSAQVRIVGPLPPGLHFASADPGGIAWAQQLGPRNRRARCLRGTRRPTRCVVRGPHMDTRGDASHG